VTGIYRVLWCAAAVPACGIGLAGGCVYLGGFAAACLAGAGAALGATAVSWPAGTPSPPARRPLLAGALGAVLPLAVIGLLAELGPAALVLVLLLAAACEPLRRRLPGLRPAADDVPPDPLPELATEELCRLWRGTSRQLARCGSAGERGRLAELRRACLDELERRDPQAYAGWTAAPRAAEDPGPFFARPRT
jgi:hypothetical protein